MFCYIFVPCWLHFVTRFFAPSTAPTTFLLPRLPLAAAGLSPVLPRRLAIPGAIAKSLQARYTAFDGKHYSVASGAAHVCGSERVTYLS